MAFVLGQESAQTDGTAVSGANSCLWRGLQLPTKKKTRAANGRPGPRPTPPQDNRPFVVLSAGSRATFRPRPTVPAPRVLRSALPRSRGDASRAGGGWQTRQEHSHVTDGTAVSHHPLPPLSSLVPSQLQGTETPPEPDEGHVPRAAAEEQGDSELGRLPG